MSQTSPVETNYQCEYCRQSSFVVADQLTCVRCGAPITLQRLASKSGWITLPGAADLARIQFGHSTAQISGSAVPVCDINLADGEGIVFFHSELLWSSGVHLESVRTNTNMTSRLLGGVPRLMLSATGPGNIALSSDWAGELIVVPLDAGQGIVAAAHHLMACTANVSIDTVDTGLYISEDENDRQGDIVSRYVNRYIANGGPALIVLHAPGNVVMRDLAQGEQIHVQPASVIYTDLSVGRQLIYQGGQPTMASMLNAMMSQTIYMTDLMGPGRIALSSVYEHVPASPGNTSLGWGGRGGMNLGGINLGGGSNSGGGSGFGGLLGGLLGGVADGLI